MGINVKLLSAVGSVNLLAFAAGNAYSWSSPMGEVLKSNDPEVNPLGAPITPSEDAWIASSISLSAAIASLLTQFTTNTIGRKNTLLLFAIPTLICNIMLIFATTSTEILVARFLLGIGVGSVFSVIPIYIGEIAESHNRGLLGCTMGLMVSLGILFCYVVGPFVHFITLSYILIIPPLLFFFLFFMAPETPYYYVSKGNYLEAEKSLIRLRDITNGSGTMLKELELIKETVEASQKDKISFFNAIKSASFKKGISLTVILMIFQQFIGITIILAYMQSIFAATGTNFSPEYSVIIVSTIQTFFVLITTSLVDKLGRKILLILSSIGSGLSLLVLGTFFYFKSRNYEMGSLSWVPIAALVGYVSTYNLALGTLPWVLSGELFSSQLKSLGATLTSTTCLILAFLTALFFPALIDILGMHGAFWFFSVNGFLCAIFVWLRLPETKGKTFQDILLLLEKL